MPIKIPDQLPARKTLEREGVVVMDTSRAARQDIRPLQIGLLNLMPHKERTETQFARLIAASPLQVDLSLVRITSHKSKTTPLKYLETFYNTWEEIRTRKFDGLIVTGAPIGGLRFEDVRYWPEMVEIMDWTQSHVHSTMFVCWGAQAALHHFHGVERLPRQSKAFGVYEHKPMSPASPYLRGFADGLGVPVSRYNDIDRATLPRSGALEILLDSPEVGICLLADPGHRALHMLNHLEYDARTLADEYDRDVKAGLNPAVPHNYYPDNDPANPPPNTWRSHGHLLFGNWINEIYQTTPYEIDRIGTDAA